MYMYRVMKGIIFILAITFTLFGLYKYLESESFVNQPTKGIQFLSARDTAAFLTADPDFYFANLTPTDLYARKQKVSSAYKDAAAGSAIDFTEDQKIRFAAAARKADEFFAQLFIKGVNCARIVEIPWVFAITSGKIYEDGLPHTRAGIIFVSDTIDETPDALLRVLVHEKVHLYTRLYPQEISYYLESNGYSKWKLRTGVPRIRANPDLDAWIYMDSFTGKPMVAYYVSDKPTSIDDIENENPAGEHPFEILAYSIDAKVASQK